MRLTVKETLYEYCQRTGRLELVAEWDAKKNAPFTPTDVTRGSRYSAWWRCSKGHSYQMLISYRTLRRFDCPYCAGRKVLVGFNDLASTDPNIAAQWHPQKNGSLTPDQVIYSAKKTVWWLCPAGHEWKAQIYARAALGCECPMCKERASKKSPDDINTTLAG